MDDYKYLAIVEWAKKYIFDHQMQPNQRFLSESELCSIHNVSRQTVRQALKMLEDEGIIVRVRGSGTYVKPITSASTDSTRPKSVGIVSTYFSDYIFPSIITGIEGVLKKNDIGIQLSTTHNRVFEEAQALRNMMIHGVSGIIVEPSKSALPNPNAALYQEIIANNIPLVFFNARYPWVSSPCVTMDDNDAAKQVTDHLFDCGHKKISAIFSMDDIQGHERYSGFMKSCETHGILQAEQNVMWYYTSERNALFMSSESRIMELLKSSTAVVCYNDKLAVELMDFCRSKGIRVPRDISIIGIDDARIATLCDVQLTTVRHPHQLMGEKAAQIMLELINSPETKQKDYVFKPKLIVRDSVRKI